MFWFPGKPHPMPWPRNVPGAPPCEPGDEARDEACEAQEEEGSTDDEEMEMPQACLIRLYVR